MTGHRLPLALSSPSALLALVLAPLIGAAIVWSGTSSWSSGAVRATADVNLAPLINTYSSYEVATHVADFSTSYDAGSSTGDGDVDPDAPGASVDSSRVGSATVVRVTYVGGSSDLAEQGLREGVTQALDTVGDGLETSSDTDLRAAQAAYRDLRSSAAQRGDEESDPAAERAGQLVAEASVQLRSTRAARADAADSVADLDVTTQPLSSTGQRLRATVVGAVLAGLLAGGALFLLRRRHRDTAPGRRGRAPDQDRDES